MDKLEKNIEKLTTTLFDNIVEVMIDGKNTATDTLVIACSLGNIVDCYSRILDDISPELTVQFHDMLKKRIASKT
jgi:hypothetical protein